MTSVGVFYLTCLNVADAIEYGYEHRVNTLVAKHVVHCVETLVGRNASHTSGAEQRTAYSHKYGSRNALAGDIGNDKSDTSVVNFEEVEKVASHFLCRSHGSIKIHPLRKFRYRREIPWQYCLLYLACHCKVALY